MIKLAGIPKIAHVFFWRKTLGDFIVIVFTGFPFQSSIRSICQSILKALFIMKKIFSIAATCLLLSSCTVHEPEQKVVVSSVEHQPLKPFKPAQPAQKPAMVADPGARRIALLLPLSGQHKELGQAMLHASEMALFDAANAEKIVFIPKDTHGRPDGASRAAQEALNEGAEIIIGPVFSQEVQAVKPLTQKERLSVLSFTTDTSVIGLDTYALGFLPEQQIKRVTEYAATQGHTKIVALTPKTPYGQVLNQTLQTLRQSGQVQVLDLLAYDPSQIYTGSGTLQQVMAKLKEAQSQGATAVVFPSAGLPLSAFASALQAEGLGSMKILGSGQWDTPNIHQTPGLQGAWYAAPSPEGRGHFESTFQQQFMAQPPRLASLAYDATALAIALAPHQFDDRLLLSQEGYSGLDGVFRLNQDGTSDRALAVMEVTEMGVNTISPAESSFN